MLGYGKLNIDGTLQSANKPHEGFVPLENFEKDIDGNYYNKYNQNGTPDLVAIQADKDAEIAQTNLEALEATDKDMIRVAEDILNLLVTKGLMTESELPQSAQDKLVNRRNARSAL